MALRYKSWSYNTAIPTNIGSQKMSNCTIINRETCTMWIFENIPHQENSHAIEWADGFKYWYLGGKLHRVSGPAVECEATGYKGWWLDGVEMTEEEHAHSCI